MKQPTKMWECEMCHKPCASYDHWTEENAKSAFKRDFPDQNPDDAMITCSECHYKLMAFFNLGAWKGIDQSRRN